MKIENWGVGKKTLAIQKISITFAEWK